MGAMVQWWIRQECLSYQFVGCWLNRKGACVHSRLGLELWYGKYKLLWEHRGLSVYNFRQRLDKVPRRKWQLSWIPCGECKVNKWKEVPGNKLQSFFTKPGSGTSLDLIIFFFPQWHRAKIEQTEDRKEEHVITKRWGWLLSSFFPPLSIWYQINVSQL